MVIIAVAGAGALVFAVVINDPPRAWVGTEGTARSSAFTVDAAPRAGAPVPFPAPAPTPTTTTQAPTTPPLTSGTLRTQPPSAPTTPDAGASWSDVGTGGGAQPTVVIGNGTYPDGAGVQFLVNETIDDRCKCRPNGFDATGPQKDSRFHIYPSIDLHDGDVLLARWNDANGTARSSAFTVGAGPSAATAPAPDPEPSADSPDKPPSGSYVPADGVNDPYNGWRGIFPISAAPIPSGYPTPATTGVPDGVQLRSSGSIAISKPGTVIDGLDIKGSVEVRASNVTIRNSRITSGTSHPVRVYTGNLVIEDSRIRGVGDCAAGIGFSNYTARRVHVTGCADGLKAGSNVTIEDSYIGSQYRVSGISHNDSIQSSGGSNIVIRHNTVMGPFQASTSAIKVTAENRNLTNVLIEGNYLSGGNYTLYTTQKSYAASQVRVVDNVFEGATAEHGWKTDNASGSTYSGNKVL